MGRENDDILDKRQVTIGFSVNGTKPRVFHVPLTRFSWMVTLVLGALTWSAIATVLLVYRGWTETPAPQPIKALEQPVAASSAPLQPSVSQATAPQTWQSIQVTQGENAFAFEEGFAISDIVLTRNTDTMQLSFTLISTDGELREGNIWALARFTDDKGQNLNLVSSDAAGIQTNGMALDSRHGSRFGIRNQKQRELELRGTVADGMRLEKIFVGLRFLGLPEQNVLSFNEFTRH